MTSPVTEAARPEPKGPEVHEELAPIAAGGRAGEVAETGGAKEVASEQPIEVAKATDDTITSPEMSPKSAVHGTCICEGSSKTSPVIEAARPKPRDPEVYEELAPAAAEGRIREVAETGGAERVTTEQPTEVAKAIDDTITSPEMSPKPAVQASKHLAGDVAEAGTGDTEAARTASHAE
jgi:hypothetical protein